MPGRASISFVLLVGMASVAAAQPRANQPDHYQLGRAAMEAHDPAAAIVHFEQTDSTEGRAWLAVALMMESRSPADGYVERAFNAAARARDDQPEHVRPRAEIAGALRPGELVVTFLVGESHAYAWAFDRTTLVGYPLPPPAQLAASTEQVKAYVAQKDQAGVERVAEDLTPALFGPILEHLSTYTRVIFVMDGPLRQLPVGELLTGNGQGISEALSVSTASDGALLDEIARRLPARNTSSMWLRIAIGAGVSVILLGAGIALRRRSSVA